jgi:hypothetical protein
MKEWPVGRDWFFALLRSGVPSGQRNQIQTPPSRTGTPLHTPPPSL